MSRFEGRLDIGRMHVPTIDDQQVLSSSEDMKFALEHGSEIAASQPGPRLPVDLAGEGLAGRFRPAEVARRDARPAHA